MITPSVALDGGRERGLQGTTPSIPMYPSLVLSEAGGLVLWHRKRSEDGDEGNRQSAPTCSSSQVVPLLVAADCARRICPMMACFTSNRIEIRYAAHFCCKLITGTGTNQNRKQDKRICLNQAGSTNKCPLVATIQRSESVATALEAVQRGASCGRAVDDYGYCILIIVAYCPCCTRRHDHVYDFIHYLDINGCFFQQPMK
jgi:hypothetical protein